MGAGKTTVGRALAKRTGWRFVDTDHEIERRTGVRIPVIFDIEGEAGFREREARVLAEVLDGEHRIVATGGGAVIAEENRRVMRGRALVCYLRASPTTLHQRTRADRNRPLLQVDDPLARLVELLNAREQYYQQAADIVFDGDRQSTAQITEQLARLDLFACQPST